MLSRQSWVLLLSSSPVSDLCHLTHICRPFPHQLNGEEHSWSFGFSLWTSFSVRRHSSSSYFNHFSTHHLGVVHHWFPSLLGAVWAHSGSCLYLTIQSGRSLPVLTHRPAHSHGLAVQWWQAPKAHSDQLLQKEQRAELYCGGSRGSALVPQLSLAEQLPWPSYSNELPATTSKSPRWPWNPGIWIVHT